MMSLIFRQYCSGPKPLARFYTIYIEEAHAIDEWFLPEAPSKACIKVHKTIEDRIQAAKNFIKYTNCQFELVCDTMKAEANRRYDAWPERLYIILNGIVVYKGGYGPFDYKLGEVQEWLINRFGVVGEVIERK